jgi:hypothetical protein
MEINKLTDLSIGAGEGNRTLVFSLEGFRRLNTVNARSDKSRRNCSLKPNRFSFLSERDQQMFLPSRKTNVSVAVDCRLRPRVGRECRRFLTYRF